MILCPNWIFGFRIWVGLEERRVGGGKDGKGGTWRGWKAGWVKGESELFYFK